MYVIFAVSLIFSLLSTARLLLVENGFIDNRLINFISHPGWLTPLMFIILIAIGMQLTGLLPSWPPNAYKLYADHYGRGAGACAVLAIVITDIWVLWVPGQVVSKFSSTRQSQIVNRFRVYNAIFGSFIILLAVYCNR